MPDIAVPRNAIEAVGHSAAYAYYAGLRERSPLFFDEGLGLWVATGHAVIDEALRHSALRVRPRDEPVPRALAGTPVGEVFAQLVRMTDGEFHAQHKPQVERAARRFSMDDVAAAAVQATKALLEELEANALLSAVPVRAIAMLLGVPEPSLDETTQQVIDFVKALGANPSAEVLAAANEAAVALMAQGEAAGLDRAAAVNRIALMQQSLDATAGLIGNAVLLLRKHEELIPAAGQPAAWRALVAEVARWDPPVHNTRRFAADDLTLAGERIMQGRGVLLVLASANRDPALNADPDRFDVARSNLRSLTFGAGAHACPGEAIAIEIAASALRTLSARDSLQGAFGRHTGYRPLPNARVPVFEN
ncbi:MAG: cytochrome P450 [Ramlibacter sp.]